jgi:iron complex outermembrane recepter protein
LQYKHPDGYFARAEWLWTGRTYFDENNTALMSQNDYSTANLRIGYAQKNYSIYGFANNITNTHYYTFKTDVRGTPGDPRMIGVKLEMNFW